MAGNYKFNDIIDIDVQFDEPVVITGNPKIPLQLGSTIKEINYLSGSGTNILRFSYQIEKNLQGLSGIQINSPVLLDSGNIEDIYGNDLDPAYSGVTNFLNYAFVDSVLPKVTSINLPSLRRYKLGEILNFDLTFNKNVAISGGIPAIPVTFGGVSKSIPFNSDIDGRIKRFTYTVASGDNSVTGIVLGSNLDLQWASIQDSFTNDTETNLPFNDTSQIILDAVEPVITGIIPPADGRYKAGDTLDWTVQFSEEISLGGVVELGIGFDNFSRKAAIQSSTSDSITFRYTIEPNLNDESGIGFNGLTLVNGVVRDLAGNDANLNWPNIDYNNIKIDSLNPSIVSITPPVDGLYTLGTVLEVSIEFDEEIFISSANIPAVLLEIGNDIVQAPYVSHTGDRILNFSFPLTSGYEDTDGIRIRGVSLNGGYIQDEAGNAAILSFNPTSHPNVRVDTVGPKVERLILPDNGTYATGDTFNFRVEFDETAFSTDLKPSIKLRIGQQEVLGGLISGSSGTNTYTFRYTIPAGVQDLDGITVLSTIELNGGSIVDSLGNTAELELPISGGTTDRDTDGIPDDLDDDIDGDGITNDQDSTPYGEDDSNTQIIIDGNPAILSLTPPGDQWWSIGDSLDFSVEFSEPVFLTGNSFFNFNLGGQVKSAALVSGSGTNTFIYRYFIDANAFMDQQRMRYSSA